jgi:hypothetical protein
MSTKLLVEGLTWNTKPSRSLTHIASGELNGGVDVLPLDPSKGQESVISQLMPLGRGWERKVAAAWALASLKIVVCAGHVFLARL